MEIHSQRGILKACLKVMQSQTKFVSQMASFLISNGQWWGLRITILQRQMYRLTMMKENVCSSVTCAADGSQSSAHETAHPQSP